MNKKQFRKDLREAYMLNYTRLSVYLFLIYQKHYDINDFRFEHIVNESINTGYNISDNDFKTIYDSSKEILRSVYDIELTNDNPIRIKD